ncbi:hypothetical protein [Niallia taxi]|uniref:hypothetical protein n=1 Tax=Niallia taxi TaxID=2499688 RepID=UPI0015F56AA2|nr:hypothetical protein [Niallia taxi]
MALEILSDDNQFDVVKRKRKPTREPGEAYVKVEPDGGAEAIYWAYIELIDTSFNMTVNEIQDYFDCSTTYLFKRRNGEEERPHLDIKNKINYIWINDAARTIMVRRLIESDHWDKYKGLLIKNSLYCRFSFEEYIKRELKKEIKYGYLFLSDFEKHKLFPKFKELYPSDEGMLSMLIRASSFRFGKCSDEDAVIETGFFPKALYSPKKLKDELGIRHNAILYRDYINFHGIHKYRINGLVRYDLDDILANPIPVHIQVYRSMTKGRIVGELLKLAISDAKKSK